MTAPIRILHLEDDPNDAELIALQLERDKLFCRIRCVNSEKEFLIELEKGEFDVILADNTGPTFSGYIALMLAREKNPLIPFIIVSGAGDHKESAHVAQIGAAGYILKDRLSELAPCIRNALLPPK